MNIEIVQITDPGVPSQERVHLRVLNDTNLSYFVLMRSFTDPAGNGVMNGLEIAYWFPAKQVKRGDQVVVYTREGVNTNSVASTGHTNFFFYWGLKETMFEAPRSCAVLLEIAEWQTRARLNNPPVTLANIGKEMAKK